MSDTPKRPWTPKEWTPGRPDMATIVDGVNSKYIYAGDGMERRPVALAHGYAAPDNFTEVYANATLIAAAPDLYEALDNLLDTVLPLIRCETDEQSAECDSAIERARAALRKALPREEPTVRRGEMWEILKEAND